MSSVAEEARRKRLETALAEDFVDLKDLEQAQAVPIVCEENRAMVIMKLNPVSVQPENASASESQCKIWDQGVAHDFSASPAYVVDVFRVDCFTLLIT